MQKLSVTLNDVETELKESRENVKNNDALNIKVKSLEKRQINKKMKLMILKRKNLNYKVPLISSETYLIDQLNL